MSRTKWLVAAVAAIVLVTGAFVVIPRLGSEESIESTAGEFGEYQPEARYSEQATESFYLPMSDGTKLGVMLYRPSENGKVVTDPLPVIWHHKLDIYPSPQDGVGPKEAGYNTLTGMTDQGYVVAQVARRGNGQSLGARRGYHDRVEAQDAYDVTQWLSEQPWSDGQVAVYGCSNTGDAAMHAVSMRPPALKAAFAGCFSWNKYDAMRRGGIAAQWGYGPTRTVEADLAVTPIAGDEDKTLLTQAANEHQASTPLAEMWRSMPYRDDYSPLVGSKFWAEGSLSTYADQIRESNVPLYVVGGWRDEFRDQGIVTALNTNDSKLLIGPWRHCENPGLALAQEALRFFDFHLKGIDNGMDETAPIRYSTVDSNDDPVDAIEWKTAQSWPPSSDQLTEMALGSDGVLGSDVHGSSSFVVNTRVECPDAGSGSTIQPCHVDGSGVSFTGGAMAQDTEVTGTPIVELAIRSDRTDGHIFAYVEDVAPDGSVEVITEGRLTASLRAESEAPYRLPDGVPFHRSYREDAQPLVPGQVATLSFDILPMSWIFRENHRMQITVTGSDHRGSIPLADADGARIDVVSDETTPSLIRMPIVGF